jgi:endonuclease YncB( thermonuclease family)
MIAALVGAILIGVCGLMVGVSLYAATLLPTPTPLSTLVRDRASLTPRALTATPRPSNAIESTSTPVLSTPIPSSPMPAEQLASVLNVINVSTIEVVAGGERQLVYYLGLSAPNTADTCFNAGRRANANLVQGQVVRLVKDVTDVDEIGRLPRYVYVGDQLINATLLQRGYAGYVPYPPNIRFDGVFALAESEARAAALGCYANLPTLPPGTADALGTAGAPTPTDDISCGQYRTCAELGTQLNYDLYIAACPLELAVFDTGMDGIGCNQREDWGYPPR